MIRQALDAVRPESDRGEHKHGDADKTEGSL